MTVQYSVQAICSLLVALTRLSLPGISSYGFMQCLKTTTVCLSDVKNNTLPTFNSCHCRDKQRASLEQLTYYIEKTTSTPGNSANLSLQTWFQLQYVFPMF